MISGKVALGGLTVEFGRAAQRFEEISKEVEALNRAQKKLLDDERVLVEDLARTYLPELSPQAVSAGLDELRDRMEAALTEQAGHRAKLEKRLAELPEEIARRELIAAEAEKAEEHAADALNDVRKAVESHLDADHARQVTEHRGIMERRSILKARRARLQTTATVERHDYEGDKAFSYLMNRRYSEPEYRPRFVTRWLDGWLARRIGYETLLRNFRILRTGPHAIQAELRRLSQRAEELEDSIDQRHAAVGERLGLIAALEAEAAAQRAVVDARGALTEARSRYDRLAAEIRAVDANRGRTYEHALAAHGEFLKSQTVAELVELARSTADPKDDHLVTKLEEIRNRLEHIGKKLGPLRRELERRASHSTSLADLARNAVTHFSSRRSRFPEEFDLAELVEAIVDGKTNAEDALGRLEAAHVKDPLLVPGSREFDGWFAELSSEFDPELGAVEVRVEQAAGVETVVVYDHHGRVLHRRIKKREG